MPSDHRTRLASIRRFDQLVAYLRDDMGWPIDSDDFEELTFEYTPEELGIDAKNAAKIQEIKRLRPLVPSQPWGIFFVKFEPKRVQAGVLRSVLGRVVLKRRASANSAERQAWAADDLLFISAFGADDERRMVFAHFSQPLRREDLPVLKVVDWDHLDTGLHLDDVARKLTTFLSWPGNTSAVKEWRERWQSAFELRPRQSISTSKQLSVRLAELARAIRDRIKTELAIETEKGSLTQLLKAFQTALIHDLDADGFADMYAQTIAYGLLSARIADPQRKTPDDFAGHMRTNPFLRELMETFLKVGGRRGKAGGPGIDFDKLGVSDVVELLDDPNTRLDVVVSDFGDLRPEDDPVTHFYELFLNEFDQQEKKRRGVFYTPRPVVSYIVRSVDELLRTEFGLADGLADTTTWGEMAKRHKGLNIPEGVSPNQDFIQILDPATGTGTFLVEVIDLIHKTLVAKWKAQGNAEKKIDALWNEYVPKHLLTRLHAYELLMAPYAIAHLKIGLKLYETGYRFGSDQRAQIYLTNALEPASDSKKQMEFSEWLPALAHEAQAVNEIKREQRFTVVIGNPPYAVESFNKGPWIDDLLDTYRREVQEEHNIQLLSDDYAKFIRLADWQVASSGHGVIGMITKNTYLNTTAFRGLRRHLLAEFDAVSVLDLRGKLYGKTPDGASDTNVFEIRVGVAILLARKHETPSERRHFRHCELSGAGEKKLEMLATHNYCTTAWSVLPIDTENWVLEPLARGKADLEAAKEYVRFIPLMELAISGDAHEQQGRRWGGGVKTNRDFLLVAFDRPELERRLQCLASPAVNIDRAKQELGLEDGRYWNTARERKKLTLFDWTKRLFPYFYGPFDVRWVAHIPQLIEIGRGGASKNVMKHLQEMTNVGLVLKRRNLDEEYRHVFVTRHTSDINCLGGQTYTIPLGLCASTDHLTGFSPNLSNFSQGATSTAKLLAIEVSAFEMFTYVYAVLHSRVYRSRYGRELRKEFPRIPMLRTAEAFRELARLGGELVALHLLESPKLAQAATELIGGLNPEVEKVSWSKNTVWIDKAQTGGFRGVEEAVWSFHIGGYQVCLKWLKDRKGRTLSKDDIAHYQKIVVALAETIRLMKEIDEVIEQHGGWPGAFRSDGVSDQSEEAARKVAESRATYGSDEGRKKR